LSSSPVAIVVVVVSCHAVARRAVTIVVVARRAVAIVVVARRAVAIIVAHRAFAIIVENGETSAHRRTKVAVDVVFFWLTGVGVTVDNVQRTTEVAMCSKRRRRRRAANDAGDVGEQL
jgi:hypothetical protein